jgi:hypothetical protein
MTSRYQKSRKKSFQIVVVGQNLTKLKNHRLDQIKIQLRPFYAKSVKILTDLSSFFLLFKTVMFIFRKKSVFKITFSLILFS